MSARKRIAVVGATGLVGREVLACLFERGHPSEYVTALGSERSAGTEADYGDDTLEVEVAGEESFRGIDAAVFAAPPDAVQKLLPAALKMGARAVDCSAASTRDNKVPLALSRDDAGPLDVPGRCVAMPSPVTAALLLLLEPLGCPTLLDTCAVTSLLGASSAGRAGLSTLEQQTAELLSGRDVDVAVFPHRLAYNLIPQVGAPLLSGGFTEEEESWRKQAGRLWQLASPPSLCGTAVQSPHFYGCLLSVSLRLRKEFSAEELLAVWRGEKGIKVLDDLAERIYPTPQLAAGDAALCVGRVRVVDGAALFVAAFDNVRFLALQAVRAAERLS